MEEMTFLEEQKAQMSITDIRLQVNKYTLAYSHGRAVVFVEACEWDNKGKAQKWIVTNGSNRSYMFKEDGLFGYTDSIEDRLINSFDSVMDAVRCFRRFWDSSDV